MDIQLIYNIIDNLITERKISKMDFYFKMGITGQGWLQSKKANTMKMETLFKVCEVLQIEPAYFFDKKDDQKVDYREKYYELLEKYNNCLELKLGK